MMLTIAATQGNEPEVHKAGCADVTRGLRSGKYQDAEKPARYANRYDVVLHWWSDIVAERLEENEYMRDHPEKWADWNFDGHERTEADEVRDLADSVKFLPCCRVLPGGGI
jgi:hypothetical protein